MKRFVSLLMAMMMVALTADGFAEGQGQGRGGTQGGRSQRGGQGGMTKESDPAVLSTIANNASKFQQFTYTDETTGITLAYSLYIPETGTDGEALPLVMYIPDSTGAGKSAQQIVEQYYGADVWVSDEDQAKHPAYVLVPAFSEVVVDDQFNASAQIDTAVALIQQLIQEYNIDTNRIYTTGQSMGCMTSLYLSSKYPDLFAAYLFVSGQWDIQVLDGLKDQTFFYIVAGGDEKASAGQADVMNLLNQNGVAYAYGTWNAQNDADQQNADTEALIAQGYKANFICFETGSVLNGGSGMEHMASFSYAYKIAAVRDWLFAQSR